MSKDYVYFFKHSKVNAVKIGKTSGESVLNRFNQFKTYSPFGSEILGFYETENGIDEEKILHKRFSSHRLNGEFFDISIDMVNAIVNEKNKTLHTAMTLLNEWIANEDNSIIKLNEILKKSVHYKNQSTELIGIKKYLIEDDNSFMTASEIFDYLSLKIGNLRLKKLGMELKLNFKRTKKDDKYGYLCNVIG